MPVNWDEATQATLVAALFHVCDIRPTEAQKAAVAAYIGQGCTTKAVAHRITTIRGTPLNPPTTSGASSVTPYGVTSGLGGTLTPAPTPPKKTARKPKNALQQLHESPSNSTQGFPRHDNKVRVRRSNSKQVIPHDIKKRATPDGDDGRGGHDGTDSEGSRTLADTVKRERSAEFNFTGGDITAGEDVGDGLRMAKKAKYDDDF